MASYIQSLQFRAGTLFKIGNNTAQIARIMNIPEDAALRYVTDERSFRLGLPTAYFDKGKDVYGNGVVEGAFVKLSRKAKNYGIYRVIDPKGTRIGKVVGNKGADCYHVQWKGNKTPQSIHRSFLEPVRIA